MAANVLGFLTSKFIEIASQHSSPFQGLNHHIPGVSNNYHTPPRPCNYFGIPIPHFGGDTISIDEEIAVGTSFSASENCDFEVEVLTPVRKDSNQESKSGDSGVQEPSHRPHGSTLAHSHLESGHVQHVPNPPELLAALHLLPRQGQLEDHDGQEEDQQAPLRVVGPARRNAIVRIQEGPNGLVRPDHVVTEPHHGAACPPPPVPGRGYGKRPNLVDVDVLREFLRRTNPPSSTEEVSRRARPMRRLPSLSLPEPWRPQSLALDKPAAPILPRGPGLVDAPC